MVGSSPPHQQELQGGLLHGGALTKCEIIEENLFYDVVGMLKQIGVM